MPCARTTLAEVLEAVLPAQGGQILIAIDQTIRLERQAFNAALGIGAKTTLSNVVASIQILDANGADASSNFFAWSRVIHLEQLTAAP